MAFGYYNCFKKAVTQGEMMKRLSLIIPFFFFTTIVSYGEAELAMQQRRQQMNNCLNLLLQQGAPLPIVGVKVANLTTDPKGCDELVTYYKSLKPDLATATHQASQLEVGCRKILLLNRRLMSDK